MTNNEIKKLTPKATYIQPMVFASDLLTNYAALKRECDAIEYGLDELLPELQNELYDMWERAYTTSKKMDDILVYSKINTKCFKLIYSFVKEVSEMPIDVDEIHFFRMIMDLIISWQSALFDEWRTWRLME